MGRTTVVKALAKLLADRVSYLASNAEQRRVIEGCYRVYLYHQIYQEVELFLDETEPGYFQSAFPSEELRKKAELINDWIEKRKGQWPCVDYLIDEKRAEVWTRLAEFLSRLFETRKSSLIDFLKEKDQLFCGHWRHFEENISIEQDADNLIVKTVIKFITGIERRRLLSDLPPAKQTTTNFLDRLKVLDVVPLDLTHQIQFFSNKPRCRFLKEECLKNDPII